MKNQTASEKLQDHAADLEGNIAYSSKLLTALNNEPHMYDWSGEILDMGANACCACGHPIRNGFPLVHKVTGETVIVGSTCVETAPGMDIRLIEQMKTAQKALQAKIAAAKKAEREMAQDSQIAALVSERDSLKEQAKALRISKMNPQVSYGYWKVCAGRYGFKRPECYKQKAACIKKLTEDCEFLKRCIAELS